MKNSYFVLFFILSLLYIKGQTPTKIIVKLKDKSNGEISQAKRISKINKLFSSNKIEKIILSEKDNSSIYTVEFSSETNIQKIIDEYYKTGEIEYAEPDYIYKTQVHQIKQAVISPNDPNYRYQWGLNNDGFISTALRNFHSKNGVDINIEKAWEIETGSDSIIVAIIDTGLNINHPEIKDRLWIKKGKNFIKNEDSNDLSSKNDHAINVAGIIGAHANNKLSYTGIDWNCKLMILKTLDNNGEGYNTDISEAIHYAVDNGARVINLSLGGHENSILMSKAIEKALKNNVVVVAAMGNDNNEKINYPAAYPGVIAVGAINAESNRSNPFYNVLLSGSNYGKYISVVAPGDVIFGLVNNDLLNVVYYMSGTSQATPHVSGLASLLLAQNSKRTPSEIKSIIEKTADDQMGDPSEDTPGWDKYYGYGRINAYRALSSNIKNEDNESNKNKINVYPNPARQSFSCDFPINTKQITIFNELGQVVISKKINGLINENFYIPHPGIYYLHFKLENGKKINKKIIIIK